VNPITKRAEHLILPVLADRPQLSFEKASPRGLICAVEALT
jgi:hypothetical protein